MTRPAPLPGCLLSLISYGVTVLRERLCEAHMTETLNKPAQVPGIKGKYRASQRFQRLAFSLFKTSPPFPGWPRC